jgi:hypothetical protein
MPTTQSENNDSGDDQSNSTNTSRDAQLAILNAENRKWRTQASQNAKELEAIKAKYASESEQALAKAKAEGESTYKTRYRTAVVENLALGRLSAKGVTALELALKALDLSHVDVDLETGHADTDAIDAAITDALKRFPMLTATPPTESTTPPVDGRQQRVTQEELLKADADKRNELLRFALGRNN